MRKKREREKNDDLRWRSAKKVMSSHRREREGEGEGGVKIGIDKV